MKNRQLPAAAFWLSACLMTIPAHAADAPPVPYVTGGIGDEERELLQSRAGNYNLQLLFAVKVSGEYLASVRVSITTADGRPVLAAEGAGPWFHAQLPTGRYQVAVETGGIRQTRWIAIDGGKPTKAYFYWPAANGSGTR